MQRRIVRLPRRDRIVIVDARDGEDGVGQLGNGDILVVIREHLLRPARVGVGEDRPVDVEAGDLFQCRLVSHGVGLVGARHLVRILLGQQHRVFTVDAQAGCIVAEGLGHAFVEPAGGAIEADVLTFAVARQGQFLVGVEGGHQSGAGLVSLFGHLARQRRGGDRRRHDQILSGLQAEPDLHRHFSEFFQLCGVDGFTVARVGGHGTPSCRNAAPALRATSPQRGEETWVLRRRRYSSLGSRPGRGVRRPERGVVMRDLIKRLTGDVTHLSGRRGPPPAANAQNCALSAPARVLPTCRNSRQGRWPP